MKVGVLGFGSIGQRHVASLQTLGHEVIVYDPATRRDVKFEREIYDNSDAVVIATPTMFHEQAVRACVERGAHMLIEKPIARQVGALPQLLASAEKTGLTVMMGNNLRFHPCVQQVKHWLAERKVGDELWASFICATEGGDSAGDGIILNTGAHEVDIALYFFGPASCVVAHDGFTSADFVLKHDNGVRSAFHLDLETPNRIREFWIAGSDQNIGINLEERVMSLGSEVKQGPGSYADDYRNEMSGFIDRINGVFAPGATGKDGLATLKVLLDVQKKAGLK